jgi:DNA-binding HxlR family transcriptional regulator
VSDKLLAQTLEALERDGLVHREAQPTDPPHVEYTLTHLGMELAERLRLVISVLQDRTPQVMRSGDRYDWLHPEQL